MKKHKRMFAKKYTNKLILVSILFLMLSSASVRALNSCQEDEVFSEVKNVPFGDPFIMLYDGKYYAYGTGSPNGIRVYVSEDLKVWEVPEGVSDGLVLNKEDVWGNKNFWAPEVYYVNGKFYMYYSADLRICVATSDSPLGPFKQGEQKPMYDGEKTIDNSLFIDDYGKPYLFFDRFNDGLNIWVVELEDNLIDIKPETMKPCIHVSQEWEKVWPRVNEGSFVTKHKGVYYMTYSANNYESQYYGVGVATAKNILGPWEKYEANPILQMPRGLVGVGHSAMFNDKNGQLRIVFHAHQSRTKIHPRNMYIASVNFKDMGGQEMMVINEDYITAILSDK